MKTPIALVAADSHLSDLIWPSRPAIQGDSFFAFNQIFEIAKTKNIDEVWLAGDVTETLHADSPNSATVHTLRTVMAKATSAGINVRHIYGNHDNIDPDWVYACGGPPALSRDRPIEVKGKRVVGIPWMPSRFLKSVQAEVEADIVICHQAWAELMPGHGYEGYLSNFGNVDLVVTGDLHKHIYKKVRRESGEPLRVLSPGATHMRKSNEPTSHYVAVLYDDYSVTWVKLRSRAVLRYVIEDATGLDAMCSQLPDALATATQLAMKRNLPSELITPLFILQDNSRISGAERRVNEVVGSFAHVFYRPGKDVVRDDSGELAESQATYSLSEFVAQEAGNDPSVVDLLQSLLVSGVKPAEVIQEHRKRYMQC